MGKHIEFNFRDFQIFFDRCKGAASGDFKREIPVFLETMGMDFLKIVRDEIVRRQVADTGQLLKSFQKGGSGNVWKLENQGLTLEVGTYAANAALQNKGYWTVAGEQAQLFIPGTWQDARFSYEPNSQTGMVFKLKWIPGTHYWESALQAFEKMFPDAAEKRLQNWINDYFST